MESQNFSELNLPQAQLDNLAALGYARMTPIQAESLPLALKGEDLIAQAKTGSGKTAAFGISLLHKLDMDDAETQALIVCPTRELSIQVADEIRKLARSQRNIKVVALYGGQSISLQKTALRNGAHVVVGTPGRIKDHLLKGTARLDKVRTLVLDEADRMLEMGFQVDVGDVIEATPETRQTLFFSATFPENIRALSARYQRNAVHVSVEAARGETDVEQRFFLCETEAKPEGLIALLMHYKPESSIVFCNFKAVVKAVHEALAERGFSVAALHGDLEQRDREEILMRFRHRSCRVLVATDIAGRGLDIEDLTAVINYELPGDPESYVHRIGRTGRAGKTGYALSLANEKEQRKIAAIGEFQRMAFVSAPIASVTTKKQGALSSAMSTLCISGGRKDKLRAGDVLGALTGGWPRWESRRENRRDGLRGLCFRGPRLGARSLDAVEPQQNQGPQVQGPDFVKPMK